MKKFVLLIILFLSTFLPANAYISCEAALKANKPFLVLYSANWCKSCKQFKPLYEQLSIDLKNNFNFVVIDVDSYKTKNKCSNQRISSIPTVYLFDKEKVFKIKQYVYSDFGHLRGELKRYLATQK